MNVATIENLYLPGLKADGTPKTLIDISAYWDHQANDQRRGERGDAYLPEILDLSAERLGTAAVLVLDLQRIDTGEIISRTITHNVLTDNGAGNMLKLFTASAGTVGQYWVLDAASAVAVQTGGTIVNGSGAQASIAVASGGNAGAVSNNKAASFISNTTSNTVGLSDPTYGGGINWSWGTANSEFVSGSGTQSSATAIALSPSYTVQGSKSHAANDNVVSAPWTTDAPTVSSAGAIMYNSTASTSSATGTANPGTLTQTAGIGNRQVAWSSVVFNTSSTPGNYTGLWVATFNLISSWAAAGLYTHVSFPVQTINNLQQLTITSYMIKI